MPFKPPCFLCVLCASVVNRNVPETQLKSDLLFTIDPEENLFALRQESAG